MYSDGIGCKMCGVRFRVDLGEGARAVQRGMLQRSAQTLHQAQRGGAQGGRQGRVQLHARRQGGAPGRHVNERDNARNQTT